MTGCSTLKTGVLNTEPSLGALNDPPPLALSVSDRRVLTFFDRLHEDRVVSTDRQPKAIVILLDYNTALNQTCRRQEGMASLDREHKQGLEYSLFNSRTPQRFWNASLACIPAIAVLFRWLFE